jgi:hypothetical protein
MSCDSYFGFFARQSPYSYCVNNPIYWKDYLGNVIVPPPGGEAKFIWDVFVYNADPSTKELLKRLNQSDVVYVITINPGLQQSATIDWQYNGNDNGVQTVNITIATKGIDWNSRVESGQVELGKGVAFADLFERDEIGFVINRRRNEIQFTGLDYKDICYMQELGVQAAKNNDIPVSGSAEDYKKMVIDMKSKGKSSDKLQKAWVSNYRERKRRVFRDEIDNSAAGRAGRDRIIPGHVLGDGSSEYSDVNTEMAKPIENRLINGFFYRRIDDYSRGAVRKNHVNTTGEPVGTDGGSTGDTDD